MSLTRSPVYWVEDEDTRLRRGSWFASTGNGFQPVGEEAADVIEMNYRSGQFPIKFETQEGSVVIHNGASVVLVPPGCTPDQYGVVPEGQPRPRLLKPASQVSEEELGLPLPLNEPTGPAEALVLVACGGATGRRSVSDCDGLRRRIGQMKQTKYPHEKRVDILPIHWHQAHTEQAQGATEVAKLATLDSVKRLREFTNGAMMDVLFYTSPIYAQPMVEALAQQVEDMVSLYREKNPDFNGKVALVGHGIAALILFDLLANQGTAKQKEQLAPQEEPKSVSEAGLSSAADSLDQLLEKLKIESVRPQLEAEQIDLEALLMLDEAELKVYFFKILKICL